MYDNWSHHHWPGESLWACATDARAGLVHPRELGGDCQPGRGSDDR